MGWWVFVPHMETYTIEVPGGRCGAELLALALEQVRRGFEESDTTSRRNSLAQNLLLQDHRNRVLFGFLVQLRRYVALATVWA